LLQDRLQHDCGKPLNKLISGATGCCGDPATITLFHPVAGHLAAAFCPSIVVFGSYVVDSFTQGN
jgi:hypothetical protein